MNEKALENTKKNNTRNIRKHYITLENNRKTAENYKEQQKATEKQQKNNRKHQKA